MATQTPSVSTVVLGLNKIVDALVGDLLASPRVTKAVSWAMVAVGALVHSTLGTDVSTALVSGGLLSHIVVSHNETK